MTDTYVFDAYGTLLDIGAAYYAILKDRTGLAHTHAEVWRNRQLEFAWVDMLTGQPPDFWHVTERALDAAMAATGLEDDHALKQALLDSYQTCDAFSDAKPVLDEIRRRSDAVLVFSNATPMMLETAMNAASLGFEPDHLISVDDAGVYKPDARSYGYLLKRLQQAPADITFISSNPWDVAGAAHAGLKTVWVNRHQQAFPYASSPPNKVISALSSLIEP